MTILEHDILVRIVYTSGMICAFALYWLAMGLAFGVLRLPRAGDGPAANVASALVAIRQFFVAVYGEGQSAVLLMQRWVRAACPRCGEREVVLVFVTFKSGTHRCGACGYAHPLRGEPEPPSRR